MVRTDYSSITVGLFIHSTLGGTGSSVFLTLNTDLGGNFTIGNQSSDTFNFSGGVVIDGNLDVNGSLTTIDSTNLIMIDYELKWFIKW